MNGGDGDPMDPRRWLRYAEEDLQLAADLRMRSDLAARFSCWHSQQAAEKAIKALLLLEIGEFELTHRLYELAELLPDPLSEQIPRPGLSMLTQLYIESRYPGNYPEPTRTEAMTAVMSARAVYDAVNREFQRRGVVPASSNE